MGIVFRQSVKSTIATFTGAILGALIIYLSSYYLPKQEFGFRATLTNYAVVGSQILLFGLHNTIAVYIHRYQSNNKRSSALLTITLVLPFFFIAFSSIIYLFFREQIIQLFQPEDVPFISHYFLWLPLFTLLFAYQVILETYLVSQLKVAKATFVREVLLRVLNIFIVVAYGFKLINYNVLIYSTVLIYIVPITILLMIAVKTDPFKLSFNWNVFQKDEKKEIIHFTWYHSLLGVTIILIGMLDALMLATLSSRGLESVPVYTISVFIISFLLIPYRAMLNSTFAPLARAFEDADKEKVGDIFIRSSINILIASTAMFLLIVCNLHNAVAVLPEGYGQLTPVVIILAIGRMADLATGVNDQMLSLSKFYKYNFYISIFLVLMIICFNWWLIPKYDVIGAAWATTIALIIYNLLKLIVVKIKLGVQPISSKTGFVVLSGVIAFIVGYYLPRLQNPVIDTIYRVFSILIAYTAGLVFFKPSDDLNEYLKSIKKNKRLF